MVCEGSVTEPAYIRGFERHVRNATVEVHIPREQGDPRKLVEIAKETAQTAAREAKRQRDEFLAYDEVWCVFDRDEHNRFDEALDMAGTNDIRLAISNPCFELWLLLHFRDSPGARHRHALQAMMKTFIAHYDKHLDFSALADGVAEATRRARRLDEAAANDPTAEKYRHNPTTNVYELTDSIARTDT